MLSPGSSGTFSAPALVERGEELRRLEEALDCARAGRGGAVFLSGETGIGKTRLAQEALVLARARGFLVLEARAYALEATLSYAPILGLFGPYLRRLDRPRQVRLVSGLPELGRLFGDLCLPPPEPLGDPELEKTRLFEALSRVLERLTVEQPVALFLDDLHAADLASVELLHYLIRGLKDQRALLLATFRTEALGDTPGLRALVRSLQRAALAEELTLSRLGQEAVAALASALLGADASPQVVAFLHSHSGGTPLFAEALVRALAEAGAITRGPQGWALASDGAMALPAGIRDLIVERLERITPTERRLVELIAVAGAPTSHAVLSAAGGLADEALLGALRRQRAAGLLAEELDGSEVVYRLAHPLLAEVAYAELPEMVRRRAHAAFAVALERLRPNDLEQLAFHYGRAGREASLSRALAVLVAAGERARAVYANEQATRHFGAALELVRQGVRPDPPLSQQMPLLPWLLERLGEARERAGLADAAIAAWGAALAEHERTGDRPAMAQLRRALGLAELDRGHFDAATAHLAAGLAALAGREASQELADLHHARCEVLTRLGDITALAATTGELLALAERLGAPGVVAEAQRAAAILQAAQGDLAAARTSAQRGLAVAEEAGELMLSYRLLYELFTNSYVSGDLPQARSNAERALALARRLGAPPLEFLPQFALATVDFVAGTWDEGLTRTAAALALARRVGQRRGEALILARRATLLTHRGEFAEAARCLAEARSAFGEGSTVDRAIFGMIELNELALALEAGQLTQATVPAAELMRAGGPTLGRIGLSAARLSIAQEVILEVQLAAGDLEAAQRTLGELQRLGSSDARYNAAHALRAEGLVRKRQGQAQPAAELLARAADAFAAMGMPFWTASTRLEWAGLPGLERGEATSAGREVLATFERLGARRYAEQARALLRGLGAPARARPGRTSGYLLSARELEVARLVVRGLTTAEIAEQLVLSPRTVTTHLDHIYARLGIGSRAALRRYVIEAGLLPPAATNTQSAGKRYVSPSDVP